MKGTHPKKGFNRNSETYFVELEFSLKENEENIIEYSPKKLSIFGSDLAKHEVKFP